MRMTVVVTGGAAGIGAALCQAFLDQGFEVICLDRNIPALVHARLHAVAVDLTDLDSLRVVADEVAGRFDVTHLVHNAGVIRPNLIENVTTEDMAALSALHLTAPLILLQAFLPAMKAAGSGRVVLISSRAALGLATRTAYAATKAGMIGLGRTWALELARHGITVNMVAPGPIGSTPMFEALVPPESEVESRIAGAIPVGRLGRPADVAHAVMFFASAASDFVTGQVLYVCGGASVGTAPL
jgi:NAD(P)-dependent dehydrogenase (short-subunit alcohol dehydrogenase family)